MKLSLKARIFSLFVFAVGLGGLLTKEMPKSGSVLSQLKDLGKAESHEHSQVKTASVNCQSTSGGCDSKVDQGASLDS